MRKIAYFSLTPSPPAPPANQKTLEALRSVFPDHQIDEFYILPLLKRSPAGMLRAGAAAGLIYAPELLRGQKKFKYAAFRTRHMFEWIKERAGEILAIGAYDFSFQMQSIFDASADGTPHFVYTDHTHLENLRFESFKPSDLYAKSWIACEHRIYANATRVFTRSSNVSTSLLEQYGCPEAKIECVYAGSNATVPDRQTADASRYGPKNILFAGIDWDRKGGPVLVEAFRRALVRHPDARLTIVGCNPTIEDLPECIVAGRVPLRDMPQFYEAATVFCMPTRVEPFGIVFVEAMWNALTILATNVGAVPDMVENGKNGYLVEPDDIETLAARLCDILESQERRAEFGIASRDLAEARYDWGKVAVRMRAAIEASGQDAGRSP